MTHPKARAGGMTIEDCRKKRGDTPLDKEIREADELEISYGTYSVLKETGGLARFKRERKEQLLRDASENVTIIEPTLIGD